MSKRCSAYCLSDFIDWGIQLERHYSLENPHNALKYHLMSIFQKGHG